MLEMTADCELSFLGVDPSFLGVESVQLLGKSKTEFDAFNCYPKTFPLFIILKELDHYYLFYARQPGAFQVVHSLNHSISNPKYFDSATFPKIIQALTGEKTPLQIKW
jgi:hypothetical protein